MPSTNNYDWLGDGIYFWGNDPIRASGYNINDMLKNKYPDEGGFHLVRPLDCAVIRNLHSLMQPIGIEFDTVCGYFQEGADAFEGAGIKEKSHIQICVRNTDCIKGYFLPRKYDHMYIASI